MLFAQYPAATPRQLASAIHFERFTRTMRRADEFNPRDAGLYHNPVTINDRGGDRPQEVVKGYDFDNIDSGIFHITGGVIASFSNTVVASRINQSSLGSSLCRVTAMVHSRYLAVKVKPNPGSYRFIVDGRFVSLTGTTLATTSGPVAQWILLDFGTRAARSVTVEGGANCGIYGFWVEPTGTCWPIDTSNALYACMLGDSYVQGVGDDAGGKDNIAAQLGDRLGFHMHPSPAGGTGWATNNSSYSFQQRIANDDIGSFSYYRPDIIFLMGSYNDRNAGQSLITANALAGLRQVRTDYAEVPIIMFGVAPGATGPNSAILSSEQAIGDAVSTFADPLCRFVPLSTDTAGAWIEGTGNVVNPTGAGNSDYLTSSDSVHPSQEGHALLALRMAKATRSALSDMSVGRVAS